MTRRVGRTGEPRVATPASRNELWGRIMCAHGAALRRVAASYERDPSRREDLFQDICLAVWRALPGFRGEASARTFVFRIAHNRGLSHGWNQGRRRSEDLDSAGALLDPAPGPEELVSEGQRRALLVDAVRSLPVGLRQVVVLALEGLSHRDIAEVVGITENNVAVRLTRARRALKQRLTERGAVR